MTVTNAKTALQAAENTFSIQKGDTRTQSILKFAGGTAAKIAVMGIAGFEYGLSKVGSMIPTSKAQNLTEYANEAAQTFVDAAKSMDKPFAPEKKESKGFFGFGKKTEVIEGPTVSSYVRAGLDKAKQTASDASAYAAKNKGTIAAGVALAAAAITLYYFGPSLFSKAAETATQTSPVQGSVNMPVFGPENMPVQGPVNMPVFGPENMPAQVPTPAQILGNSSPAANITAPVVQLSTSELSNSAIDKTSLVPFTPFTTTTRTDSFTPMNIRQNHSEFKGFELPSFNMTGVLENSYIQGIMGFGSKAKNFFASLPSLLSQSTAPATAPASSNATALVGLNATNATLLDQCPVPQLTGLKTTVFGGSAATFALTLLAACCFRTRSNNALVGAPTVVPSDLGLSQSATKKLISWINQGKDTSQTTFGGKQLSPHQIAQFRAFHNI